MHLGERLRAVRMQQDIGLHKMARLLNVSTWQIQLVESGKTANPSLGYVWRCAEVYGMSLDALLNGVMCPSQRLHGKQRSAVCALP